jgi:hypothetical protein
MKQKKQESTETRHAFELPDGQHILPHAHEMRNGFTKCGKFVTPSPGRIEIVNRLFAERQGVSQLLEAVNQFAAKRLAEIAEGERKWWEAVSCDLGLFGREGMDRLCRKGDQLFLRDVVKEDVKK